MKTITKLKLAAVHQACDIEEKSTEYTLQVMQNICKVDLDTCISYMSLSNEEHSKLFSEVNKLVDVILNIDQTLNK